MSLGEISLSRGSVSILQWAAFRDDPVIRRSPRPTRSDWQLSGFRGKLPFHLRWLTQSVAPYSEAAAIWFQQNHSAGMPGM